MKENVSSTSRLSRFEAEGNKDTQSYVTTRSRSRCSNTTSDVHSVTSSQPSMSTDIEHITRKRFLPDEAIQVPDKRYRRTQDTVAGVIVQTLILT